MKIENIDAKTFGIFRNATTIQRGNETLRTLKGVYKNKEISISSQYENGSLIGKLYYVQELLGKFIKLKLLKFENGKKKVLSRQGHQ